MTSHEPVLPISLVAHTVFCPRRAWLESVGESVESTAIESGLAAHSSVDRRADDRAKRRRSVDVWNHDWGLTGRCDVVEMDAATHRVRVVEFKSAPLRRSAEVTDPQRVQLTLQGECLRSMGFEVAGYSVYFTTSRTARQVDVDEISRAEARAWVDLTRSTIESTDAPPPLVDDPRCGRCSHASVCLPDERRGARVRRRVLASDPEGLVLHLATSGSRASLRQSRVEVTRGGENVGSVPIERVQAVVVHGNADVSSALLRELQWRRLPVVWCSFTGRVVGYAVSAHSPNGAARVAQHVASAAGRMDLAREFVGAKIANQATQLRRGSRHDVSRVVARLRSLAKQCREAPGIPQLMGREGEAAAAYFAAFPAMFGGSGQGFTATWDGRQGRGATDPLNVALNFAYGLLVGEATRAVLTCGLDPHAGFLHSSSRNKPALALDLIEEFRSPVAESVVVGAINNGELTTDMFTDVLGGSRMRDTGRKVLVRAFERRITQEFRHPLFGYRLTWRRALEVQARMVLGVLDGTQPGYRGVRPR